MSTPNAGLALVPPELLSINFNLHSMIENRCEAAAWAGPRKVIALKSNINRTGKWETLNTARKLGSGGACQGLSIRSDEKNCGERCNLSNLTQAYTSLIIDMMSDIDAIEDNFSEAVRLKKSVLSSGEISTNLRRVKKNQLHVNHQWNLETLLTALYPEEVRYFQESESNDFNAQ
ncbi:hypothetical protein BDP27DRAFT_1404084 [Rhodocollybia butyracea]|uniref:Uncharacterized protein n=1 Tax=Rhodocollybia butyracea TaxID=206335 RepID=A0A9P5PS75_9AGAR|nr:hypothetical protein BDP27DRAFT_1404084 [Rhodocollybia butyracea]